MHIRYKNIVLFVLHCHAFIRATQEHSHLLPYNKNTIDLEKKKKKMIIYFDPKINLFLNYAYKVVNVTMSY